MELSEEEKITQKQAVKFMGDHKEELVDKFIISKRPLRFGVLAFFMAGSPGAGKTEFSKRYMPAVLNKKDPRLVKNLLKKGIDIESVDNLFVRIDVDEIREFLPQYRKTDLAKKIKGNSHVIQKAANKGLDILRDYCFKENISFLHDGTFGNFETMRELIKKSLRTGRNVEIFYMYLDPLTAWEFTKIREFEEGRNIVKEKFIEQFFNAKENVKKIKAEFGKKIKIHYVFKDEKNQVISIQFNIPNLDIFLKKQYNNQLIKEYSPGDLQSLISEV